MVTKIETMLSLLVVALTIAFCGACGHGEVETPRAGVVLDDCPAEWSVDAIDREIEALVLRLPLDTLDEQLAVRDELSSVHVICEWSEFAALSSCGPGVHGGCVDVAGLDPLTPHFVKLAIIDRFTGDVEDFCSGYLVVELTKIAGWAVGYGDRVLERDDEIGAAFNAATRPCEPTSNDGDA